MQNLIQNIFFQFRIQFNCLKGKRRKEKRKGNKGKFLHQFCPLRERTQQYIHQVQSNLMWLQVIAFGGDPIALHGLVHFLNTTDPPLLKQSTLILTVSHIYIYVYIHMYIYIYIIYIYVNMYIYIYICMYDRIYIYNIEITCLV